MECIYEEIVKRFPKVKELKIAQYLANGITKLGDKFKDDVYTYYEDNYRFRKKAFPSSISSIDCENQFQRQLGIYPAKWYGDVPPKKKDELYILCML